MSTETMASFEARVLAATGIPLAAIPETRATTGDTLPGPILVKRDNVYICATGYPVTLVEDGEEVYETFVAVTIY